MSKGRVKKYVQSAIPAAITEKGGYSARFVSDGFSVDARTEILPQVIREQGLQIGEEPGWALIYSFLKACANHSASTGETVNIDSLMTFGLSIRGWYANKTSKAAKENVHVTAKLLGDLRPSVNFSMSNVNEGNTLMLVTVMSPGCKLDEVKQGSTATINGKWVKLLDDGTGQDYVKAEVALPGGQKVGKTCTVIESDDDHITFNMPGEFSGADLVGKAITFTVYGRCGDPEAGVQDASITAKLLDGGAEIRPSVDRIVTDDVEGVVKGEGFTAEGSNLSWGAGDSVTVRWTQGGEEKTTEIVPTSATPNKMSFDAVAAFNDLEDGTVLTFVFALGGQSAETNANFHAEA